MGQQKEETKHAFGRKTEKFVMPSVIDSIPPTESHGFEGRASNVVHSQHYFTYAPILITPTNNSIDKIKTTGTPDTVETEDGSRVSRDEHDKDASRLEGAKQNETRSTQILKTVSEAIRALTRLMQRASCLDNPWPASDILTSPLGESMPQNDGKPCTIELAGQVEGTYGSDLQGLINTVHMVLTHSRLASEQTFELVREVQMAQKDAETAIYQCEKAEVESIKLKKLNKVLQKQVTTLQCQRRILVTEIRSLRKQLEEAKEISGICSIIKALQVHESCLTSKLPTCKEQQETGHGEDVIGNAQRSTVSKQFEQHANGISNLSHKMKHEKIINQVRNSEYDVIEDAKEEPRTNT